MKLSKKCPLVISALCILGTLLIHPALADTNWPQRPVTIVVAFAPGGSTDILARKLSQELTTHYQQSFVVENKVGAGGNIGTAYAARAKPDGYTLYLGTVASHGVAPNLYKKIGYDPLNDFTFIGTVARSPQVVVVNKDSIIKNVEDLVTYARSENSYFASSGSGTTVHLAGELFNLRTGVKMDHVPFSGSGPAINALLGGHVDVMFDDMPSSSPHIRAGALRAIAVTSENRSELFPEIPTLSEVGKPFGLDGFDVSAWFFLGAPANVSTEILDELNRVLVDILAKDEMKKFLQDSGASPFPQSREETKAFITKELKKWDDVITSGNIQKL